MLSHQERLKLNKFSSDHPSTGILKLCRRMTSNIGKNAEQFIHSDEQYKMVQSPWKRLYQFVQQTTFQAHDSANPHTGSYLTEVDAQVYKKTYSGLIIHS